MVISQKLSKIDPQLLWNTIGKLAPLNLLPHSDPPHTKCVQQQVDLVAKAIEHTWAESHFAVVDRL